MLLFQHTHQITSQLGVKYLDILVYEAQFSLLNTLSIIPVTKVSMHGKHDLK